MITATWPVAFLMEDSFIRMKIMVRKFTAKLLSVSIKCSEELALMMMICEV
jgi:hypothetical protein